MRTVDQALRNCGQRLLEEKIDAQTKCSREYESHHKLTGGTLRHDLATDIKRNSGVGLQEPDWLIVQCSSPPVRFQISS